MTNIVIKFNNGSEKLGRELASVELTKDCAIFDGSSYRNVANARKWLYENVLLEKTGIMEEPIVKNSVENDRLVPWFTTVVKWEN